jgi:putative ABC transport system permease protein
VKTVIPDWKPVVHQQLAPLRLPPERELEIAEELALHLEAVYDEALRNGATEAEAQARALRVLADGGLLECELSRVERPWRPPVVAAKAVELLERRGGMRMESLWQDLRFGARMLLKNPGFSLIAMLTLALGIGANTAIFTVINGVLLQPLPFHESERLVRVFRTSEGENRSALSFPDFADMRTRQSVFEHMGIWRSRECVLTGMGEPLNLRSMVVTANLFPLLGTSPQRGRGFTTEEDQAGKRAVILSHNLWQQRFNADPKAVGMTVTLNSQNYYVVGVMPAGFSFPLQNDPIDLWLSLATAAEAEGGAPLTVQRGFLAFNVIGRLKPNVTVAQADAALRVIADNLARQFPNDNKGSSARVVPFHQDLVRDVRLGLLLLSGAVGCVLLIACANVANLLLARATARYKEMSIRAALGASRWRIVWQLLTESLLLACGGGVLGGLLAWWGTKALLALVPRGLPRALAVGVDARVLGFTVLISLVTGVFFGLAPALQAAKTDLNNALKEGGKSGSDSARRNRFRSALIVAEVAIALILLVGAGLLVNSFWRLQRVNPGFDPHNALTFRITLPANRYSQQTQVAPFFQQLLARLEVLPGVKNVSAVSHLPLSPMRGTVGFSVEGMMLPPNTPFPYASDFRAVTPGYFGTMGLPLIKGRDFTARDDLKSTPVTIISESLARRYFPNQDPIGKRINPSYSIDERGELMREIVGIVGDAKHVNLSDDAPPTIYVAHGQIPRYAMTMVMRTTGDPNVLSAAVRKEVQMLDKELPAFNFSTLDQYLNASVAEPKFNTLLLGLFAGLALLLTAIGLYGVVSYSVTQRIHELGIRMALGASARDVLRLVIKQGMGLALLGIAIGMGGALALTRLMKKLLYGVSPTDPLTFVLLAVVVLLVALLACWIPARRASRVDPLVALRTE